MATLTDLENQRRRHVKATDSEINAFIRRLEAFVDQNVARVVRSALSDRDLSIFDKATILGQITSVLREAGLSDQINRIEEIYASELGRVQSSLKLGTGKDIEISDFDIQLTETLITFDGGIAAKTLERHVDRVQSILMRQTIIGETPDLDRIRDDVSPSTFRNLETELNTNVMAFNRTMHFKKAEDLGLDKFLYVGPLDKITRDFCREIVGKVFTKVQILQMDNEQGLDVFSFGGGFNCRHRWNPLEDTDAENFEQGQV